MKRYKIYTGPTLVESVAERLRKSPGVEKVLEGTENIYVTCALTTMELFKHLTVDGRFTGWKLADIILMGEEEKSYSAGAEIQE
jgi:hypothetical protein